MMFAKIDKDREATGKKEPKKAYEHLKKLYDDPTSKSHLNVELLWRLARACYDLSLTIEEKVSKKKELIKEGQSYAVTAFKLEENFNTAIWAAALTGQLVEYLGTKEKIVQGDAFRTYLDKAFSINPRDHYVLHMRGRFSFNIAELSWIERKIASTLFNTIPVTTYDEAISYFLEVEMLKDGWIENRIYLARSYLAKNEKEDAIKYLKLVLEMEAVNENDKILKKQANALLKKHDK